MRTKEDLDWLDIEEEKKQEIVDGYYYLNELCKIKTIVDKKLENQKTKLESLNLYFYNHK